MLDFSLLLSYCCVLTGGQFDKNFRDYSKTNKRPFKLKTYQNVEIIIITQYTKLFSISHFLLLPSQFFFCMNPGIGKYFQLNFFFSCERKTAYTQNESNLSLFEITIFFLFLFSTSYSSVFMRFIYLVVKCIDRLSGNYCRVFCKVEGNK